MLYPHITLSARDLELKRLQCTVSVRQEKHELQKGKHCHLLRGKEIKACKPINSANNRFQASSKEASTLFTLPNGWVWEQIFKQHSIFPAKGHQRWLCPKQWIQHFLTGKANGSPHYYSIRSHHGSFLEFTSLKGSQIVHKPISCFQIREESEEGGKRERGTIEPKSFHLLNMCYQSLEFTFPIPSLWVNMLIYEKVL